MKFNGRYIPFRRFLNCSPYIKLSLIILCSNALSGCVSTSIEQIQAVEPQAVEYPKIGEVRMATLGDPMIAKGTLVTGNAIEVGAETQFGKAEGESSLLTCAKTIEPGGYFLRGYYDTDQRKANCYGPVNFRGTLSDGSTNSNCPGFPGFGDICIDEDDKYFFLHFGYESELLQDFDHLETTENAIAKEGNYIQELVYGGLAGTEMKFVYKEFTDSADAPSFSQEFEFSLEDSSIVNFKSVRFEVIEVSNAEITYRLIENF